MQSAESMHASDAQTYFEGERTQGFAWLIAGVLAATAAVFARESDYAEAFWPLAIVGVIHAAIGVWLVLSSRGRVAKITSWSDEQARIRRVCRTFVILEIVELVLVLAAAVTAFVWADHRWLFGGIAIAIAVTFEQDRVAHGRARTYLGAFVALPAQRAKLHAIMERRPPE